jgi:hypothetical protein
MKWRLQKWRCKEVGIYWRQSMKCKKTWSRNLKWKKTMDHMRVKKNKIHEMEAKEERSKKVD